MKKLFLASTVVVALSACASSGPTLSSSERLALLNEHAGEPVNSIRSQTRFTGWSAVGNSAMVLQTRPSEAFLIDFTGPCSDLPFAQAIRVSNRGGTIAARFDSVTPVGPGTSSIRIRCHIRTIRPLDVAALRQAKEQMREATPVERAAEDQAPADPAN